MPARFMRPPPAPCKHQEQRSFVRHGRQEAWATVSAHAARRLLFTGLNAGKDSAARIVGAEGVNFILGDGRRLLDASNTAGPLGHGHPAMVRALRAAADHPVVNEGWYWPEREEAARELIEVAFAADSSWVGAMRFFLSGSEANDIALSLAQALTGRSALATRERAYHGMTGLALDMTVQPHWHGGLSLSRGGTQPVPAKTEVIQLPKPQGARIGGDPVAQTPAELLSSAPSQLSKAAAVIVDYTQGGIYHDAAYQDTLAQAARDAGTLWIADEVVTGFGRCDGWFQFQSATSRPDIVTLGKPLAAGSAPAGAVVVSEGIANEISTNSWQTYSTFRGHPIAIAAVRAHLQVLVQEDLVGRARELDGVVLQRLTRLASEHASVARIDGRGLHWTIELHGPDWRSWHADVAEPPIATQVAARAAEAGALIGTSGEQTSLFIAPPLIIEECDLHRIIDALDHGLELADQEYLNSRAE